MAIYDLHKFLREKFHNGSSDLVNRNSGKLIRQHIVKMIGQEENGTLIALDFSNIGAIDFSSADELAAKLVSRLLGGEYGDRYIMLKGLSDSQKENIEVALERKGLAVMAEMRDGTRVLLGNLNNYLRSTLDLITKTERMTAKSLSDMMGIEANTSGTRLLNLHKKRLVKRMEDTRKGGKVWTYEKL